MARVDFPSLPKRLRGFRAILVLLIALFLLYVALLPSPPLPHVVHQVLHAIAGAGSRPAHSSPGWIATALRKLPEASLYFLLALLLTPSRKQRLWTFLGVAAFGLILELLRPLHPGRAFEPWDVVWEAIAALVGAFLGTWLRRWTSPTRDV